MATETMKMSKNIYGLANLLLAVIFLGASGCASTSGSHDARPVIDRISEAELERIAPKPIATLTLDDIVKLSREGQPAEQIIEKIKASDSQYDLTPSQSVALSEQGVDRQVLDYIHNSRELAWRNSVAAEINKREQEKRAALDKLKQQLQNQQRFYDPFCRGYGRFFPYGYGAFAPRWGSHFGFGAGYMAPWGCW